MLNSKNIVLVDYLKKFKFQKKEMISDSEPESESKGCSLEMYDKSNDNCQLQNGIVCSNMHTISDSEDESTSTSLGPNSPNILNNKQNFETKSSTSNQNAYIISDSDEDQPVIPKKRKIASSESEGETTIKKYSRIKNFEAFNLRKKKKLNVDESEDECSLEVEPEVNTSCVESKTEFNEHIITIDSSSSVTSQESSKNVEQLNKKHQSKHKKKETEVWVKETMVYNSDESDSETELSEEMTDAQQRVFEFLNLAKPVELLQIQSCTQNKINVLIELRPFSGWIDLVTKLKRGKGLGTVLLNYALDVLKTKNIISKLMQKCVKLAIKTETNISKGVSSIQMQPKILTPKFKLKSYQLVGLNWLAVMHEQGVSGILADEMGLGKTIQVIAFLAHLHETGQTTRPHLIVAPSSTLENWAIEFTRWCPQLRVVIYHGSQDERRGLRVLWFKEKFKEMDVIITSYRIVSGNYEEKKMFKIVPMQYVVFDEAHMLKNMNSQRYFNLFNINAEHRILLTGTPLQNNLLELLSLLNFVMPDMFLDKLSYIKTFFSKNAKLPVESLADFEQEQVGLAKRIMKPFVLRRLKDDVLRDLPEKTSTLIYCDMTPDQDIKYKSLILELKEIAKESGGSINSMHSFMKLRRLANHPLACRFHYDIEKLSKLAKVLAGDINYKENNVDHVLEDLMFMSDHDIHKLTLNYKSIRSFSLKDAHFLEGGKFGKLDEVLPQLKSEDHRVIIFSQFVFILDLLEEYLKLRKHSYLRFDGSTDILERQGLIDNYNEDESIFAFLLSTKAGGMGINLTTADTVIIHDVDFNPYNDKQAEDRCHRLGQTKPVHVMRLISKGTVEESIYSQAQTKLNLEQELTGINGDEELEENRNVEILLKEMLGLVN